MPKFYTTVIAFKYPNGIVVGADTRSVYDLPGDPIASDDVSKVCKINSKVVAASSGDRANTHRYFAAIKNQAEEFAANHPGVELPVSAAARKLSKLAKKAKNEDIEGWDVYTLVAGYTSPLSPDEVPIPKIFFVRDDMAMEVHEKYRAVGSGGGHASRRLRKLLNSKAFLANPSREYAIHIAERALAYAASRDECTGGSAESVGGHVDIVRRLR